MMAFKQKSRLLAFFLLLSFFIFKTASADLNLSAGELQLDVAGVFLDIEGSVGSLDQIAFNGDNFDITMNTSQRITISSVDRRTFTISPDNVYVSKSCTSSKSSITFDMGGISSPITYNVTVNSATCSVDGGGGGGGEAGTGAGTAPALTLAPPPPVLIPISPLIPPPELPPLPEELAPVPPPVEQPPEVTPVITPELPPPVPPEEIPPATVAQTISAAQTIGSSAVNIGASIGEGMFQIITGLATGQKGFGNIVKNIPNTGIYAWNTSQPLLPDPDAVLKNLAEGGDYSISIQSSSLPEVRDISDYYFSFIRPRTVAFLTPKKTAYLLSPVERSLVEGENILPTAEAQEGPRASLKIISPNGGEIWNIGGTYDIKWESKNLEPGHPINLSIYKERVFFGTEDALKIAGEINKEVRKAVAELRADKAVVSTVKNIAVPVSITVTAASAGALTVTATAGSASFAINLSEFFQALSFSRFYLLGLIRFKKKKPWGKISDKFNGMPIGSAAVQIYESEFKKIKESQITDGEGRFGTLVGPGKYYVKVFKKGFQTYQSDIIEITSSEQSLNLEIYLSPVIEEWSVEILKHVNILNALKRFIEFINPYLLAFGTMISALSAVILPNNLNYAVFLIYIILDSLKIYFATHLLKPFGKVTDETANEPLPLTIVRIFDAEKNFLLATKVTDNLGRFDFLLTPGKYFLTCGRNGFVTYKSEIITVQKTRIPYLDIRLKRVVIPAPRPAEGEAPQMRDRGQAGI